TTPLTTPLTTPPTDHIAVWVALPPGRRAAHTIDLSTSGSYDRAMRAVRYVVRTRLRSLVVPGLVLTAVVGVVRGICVARAPGAHLTEPVPARVDAAAGIAFDYVVTQQESGQRPLTDRV